MKKMNTVPSPAAGNGHQAASNDATPKGRYKSVLLTPRRGLPSSSTLTPGFLHSFGFAKTRSSSESEASESSVESTQQAATTDKDGNSHERSKDSSSSLPQQDNNFKAGKHVDLSESQLNLLSYNLSEIADRISPSRYDQMIETDFESSETLMDNNLGQSSEATYSNSEQSRFKTPYSRRRRDSKSYVSKQKSFTRRRSQSHNSSQQEMNNNEEIAADATNVISLANPEAFKQLDSESDSGYSSSMSTSISLSEEIEASKRLSLENGSITDIDTDDLAIGGDDPTRKNSVEKSVTNENSTHPLLHRNSSNLGERLDSLIHGVSSGIDELNLNGTAGMDVSSQGGVSNSLDEPSASFKLSFIDNQGKDELKEKSKEPSDSLAKPPVPLQKYKVSSDDTALPRTKSGRRPGILRRRTTLVSFRPPKQMTVQEGESDIVEMDEVGFLQLLTDIKSLKTQLLKLKRELQEADVVSPLMHSHSCVVRRASISVDSDPSLDRASMVYRKRMMLNRTTTMDASTMQEKLNNRIRTSSFSSVGEGEESLDDTTEQSESSRAANHAEPVTTAATNEASTDEEVKKLREELGEVKNKLVDLTQERNSLMIAREELEHELDSKNHTIRMLQKQLEAQDNRDEIAYFKRQVKSLTDQIQQQQQKITELRYRSTSPGPVPLGTVPNFQNKKETVKADIRNRLRDAFVRHLGESSKSHVQLSKHIQKAEQNITMAQKGLSSLYSSPVLSPHASTEHLPKDKSRPSFERSDSQSSVERSQEDSDGREYESDSSRSSRRGIPSSGTERNNGDSGSDSGKSGRIRRVAYPGSFPSQEESDGRMSDSDSGKTNRRRVASPPFERDTEKLNSLDSGKTGVHLETTDTAKASKQNATPSAQRTRKLSRSKLLSKIESSPLSHSWTPGAIEKIVKSWRETKSPEAEDKTKDDGSGLKPV